MAVTRRGYIFGAFFSSVLSVALIIVAVSSDSWIVSINYTANQNQDSTVNYGMFRGEFVSYVVDTPSRHSLYMTCIPEVSACAVSCKTEKQAREVEVRALAEGFRTLPACSAVTTVITVNPLEIPPVIPFGLYVSTLVILFLHLGSAVVSAVLAIINAVKNPTEPVFGLPGCLWTNVVTTVFGLIVMLLFGIYWATSNLRQHLAFSYTAVSDLDSRPALGYSYWILIVAVVCSAGNIVLIELRRYLLERDPPPPTIKVENHSDGTTFLY